MSTYKQHKEDFRKTYAYKAAHEHKRIEHFFQCCNLQKNNRELKEMLQAFGSVK